MDDVVMWLMGLFVACMALFLVGVVVLAVTDTWQERKSFPAVAACKAKRMDAMRQSLSASVVCVPVNTRQDTTTVQVR